VKEITPIYPQLARASIPGLALQKIHLKQSPLPAIELPAAKQKEVGQIVNVPPPPPAKTIFPSFPPQLVILCQANPEDLLERALTRPHAA
jgi:hypothetical protein